MAKDRKAELNTQIEDLRRKSKICLDEVAKHDKALAASRSELETLNSNRSAACEQEAQGEPNDLSSIDSKITKCQARIHGSQRLRDQNHEQNKAIENQLGPLHAELRELGVQAEIDKQAGEIAEEERQAMALIAQRNEITKRLTDAVASLRARAFHSHIVHIAHDAAERICRVSSGMTP